MGEGFASCRNGAHAAGRTAPEAAWKTGRGGRARHTGIKLLAIGGKGASVMHLHLVAGLGLAITLDRHGDVDLEVLSGDSAQGGRSQQHPG